MGGREDEGGEEGRGRDIISAVVQHSTTHVHRYIPAIMIVILSLSPSKELHSTTVLLCMLPCTDSNVSTEVKLFSVLLVSTAMAFVPGSVCSSSTSFTLRKVRP